jgi:hypothetical protein
MMRTAIFIFSLLVAALFIDENAKLASSAAFSWIAQSSSARHGDSEGAADSAPAAAKIIVIGFAGGYLYRRTGYPCERTMLRGTECGERLR